jgi:uncharacterized membrane protein
MKGEKIEWFFFAFYTRHRSLFKLLSLAFDNRDYPICKCLVQCSSTAVWFRICGVLVLFAALRICTRERNKSHSYGSTSSSYKLLVLLFRLSVYQPYMEF